MGKEIGRLTVSTLEEFISLSRALVGVENLDEELGRQYLDRLISSPFEPSLRKMLRCFGRLKRGAELADQVRKKIVADDALRPTVCQVILLWYTSGMQDNLGAPGPAVIRYGSEEAYFSGLGWQIIGAHVPGLSGGYFGHWRYRPENEPKEGA